MMNSDRTEFWRLMGEYARVMDVYLSLPRIEGIDYDRLIDETEAEVWAMIDRHREGLDNVDVVG